MVSGTALMTLRYSQLLMRMSVNKQPTFCFTKGGLQFHRGQPTVPLQVCFFCHRVNNSFYLSQISSEDWTLIVFSFCLHKIGHKIEMLYFIVFQYFVFYCVFLFIALTILTISFSLFLGYFPSFMVHKQPEQGQFINYVCWIHHLGKHLWNLYLWTFVCKKFCSWCEGLVTYMKKLVVSVNRAKLR